MTRTEKRKVLQDAMQGHTAQLYQLKRQISKKQMPYLEATGFVDTRHCSPLLMDIDVVYNESLLNGASIQYEPLREYLSRFTSTAPKKHCYDSALAVIEANNSQYDLAPLTWIEITYSDYSKRCVKGGTVADLRRLHSQCSESVDKPYFALLFETNPARIPQLTP